MSRIQTKPTDGLSYSPLEKNYFHPEKLHKELERGFDICHGCRLCFNLCPSFPALFDAVDRNDGDVTKLTAKETDYVIDTCFQCKICYVKCPYTPAEGHDFQLDYPALLQRAKAVRVQSKGVAFREKLLGNPDFLGKIAKLFPFIVNIANRVAPNRWLLEKILGIHRKKILPDFHGKTFQKWFDKYTKTNPLNGENGKVFLFSTCFVNYNNPGVGKALIEVLEKNQVTVRSDYKQCCGMPALDGGDVARAQELAKANIKQLLPYVKEGHKILAINPTCSMMMRKEYPLLVEGPDAKQVAEAVMDPAQYIDLLRKDGKMDTSFKSAPARVAYHVPCHIRAQNIGFRSRDLMRSIGEETEVEVVAECCGHDGTWAMKKEYFDLSLKYGKKAFDGVKDQGLMTTDCPLAALHFEQATGTRPMHPMEVLAQAYRGEAFPDTSKKEED